MLHNSKKNGGFTLIESLIAVAIFAVVSVSIYLAYSNILDIFSASYLNLTALSAIENELEIIRNMSYGDVGIQGGLPAGVLVAEKNIVLGEVDFVVKTLVRNVDDPFDGLQGGSPNDSTPADYKLIEVEVSCPACLRYIPAKITTTVAPQGLESVTNRGTLLIQVINASGQPVAGAGVSVVNNNVSPAVNISDVTDISGTLKLIDVPVSNVGYAITVSKSGYSIDRTYNPGDLANPNPLKPHATVVSQQVTQISFVIDRVSTLNFRAQDEFCAGIPGMDFIQDGFKLIGTNPDILKYSVAHATDISGNRAVYNLEFDTYDFRNQDLNFEISGSSPMPPVVVDPNGSYGFTWLTAPKNPSGILISVKNQNSQMINDAKVTLSRPGLSQIKYSGQKFLNKSDWSGGQYSSKTGLVETDNPAGQLVLGQINGKYATSSQELISSTVDFGTSVTVFYGLSWNPVSQPPQAGPDSLSFQIAANNDNSTWNFIGPDGTPGSFYTVSGTDIYSGHDGNRYLRYKVFLKTVDDSVTPSLDDLTVDFHSSCIPDGQVYFDGLTQDTYTVTIEKGGYQTFTDTDAIVNSNWEDYRAVLQP